jgi:hypothetical protein
MEPNHVTAIIGAVLLIIAGTGLFVVEEPSGKNQVTSHKYHLTFPLTNDKETSAGTANDGQTSEALVTVDTLNLTIAGVIVRWTDNQPRFTQAAMVSVQVNDPSGTQVGAGQGQDGGTGVVIGAGLLNEVPPEDNITASSEARAWAKVLDDYPTVSNGTGGWKLTITVTRGGFHPIRSGSVDFTIDLIYQFYQADLEEVK